MTSNRDDEHLDRLLDDWIRQSDGDGRLESLHQQILMTADEVQSDAPHSEPTSRRLLERPTGFGAGQCVRFEQKGWTAQLVVAVAAMLMLSLGVFLSTELRQPTTVALTDVPPEFAWLNDDKLQSKAALLAEMESLFDGQLAWLAEDGNRIELGLTEATGPSSGPVEDQRLAVRLVVVRRDTNSSDWQVAWAMDVASRPEELVRVASKETSSDTLQLWSYQLPDGLIAVDCNLQLAGDVKLNAESSTLCRNGQPQQILETTQGDIEYRVFQTVALLDSEVG